MLSELEGSIRRPAGVEAFPEGWPELHKKLSDDFKKMGKAKMAGSEPKYETLEKS